jgi:hypothetical protein
VYYTWVKHVETEASKVDAGAGGTYERVPMNDLERGQKQPPE